MEDREVVPVVLEEPDLGVDLELEAVGRGGAVAAGHVALGASVAEEQQPARLVRVLRARVLLERGADLRRDHHQTVRSIDVSTSAASQKSADRYFQPPSGRTQTTTASSRSAARRRATCATAPDETPAKMPSSSSRRRIASTDSSFETSTFRSSFATSRIGGTYPSSSERSPITGSPGSGSAAATTTPGQRSRRRAPVPISVPPVPRPATSTSTRSRASTISAPVPS